MAKGGIDVLTSNGNKKHVYWRLCIVWYSPPMWVKTVRIQNIRCFEDTDVLELSRGMNLLVGANNSGKSTVVRALAHVEANSRLTYLDVRAHEDKATIRVLFDDHYKGDHVWDAGALDHHDEEYGVVAEYLLSVAAQGEPKHASETENRIQRLLSRQPSNFLVRLGSHRKPRDFGEQVGGAVLQIRSPDFNALSADIAALCNDTHPGHPEFCDWCNRILGFVPGTIPSANGSKPGIYTSGNGSIPFEKMGDGVTQITGLIARLVVSKHKLILIEEPETDLHPRALKNILDLIEQKSAVNQFVITTHSSVVVKRLANVEGARLFETTVDLTSLPPTSTIREVPNCPKARIDVLSDLGYEPADFFANAGWLILEEASAESVIKDILIPFFARKLHGRLGTMSAHGVGNVGLRFDDLHEWFVLLHLEGAYRNRAWVAIDDGQQGKTVVKLLKQKFCTWDSAHFRTWGSEDFEWYYPKSIRDHYPQCFSDEPDAKKRLKECKAEMRDKLEKYARDEPDKAKGELAESAKEVIDLLKEIDLALAPGSSAPAKGRATKNADTAVVEMEPNAAIPGATLLRTAAPSSNSPE